MVDFNSTIRYLSTIHAEKRAIERTGCHPKEAQIVVRELADNGRLILEIGRHRYLKCGEFFLPCILHRQFTNHNIYVVKSVLKWDMVKHRLQRIVDKYCTTID